MQKCYSIACQRPATHRVRGMLGGDITPKDYCEPCASQYVEISRAMGCAAEVAPIEPPEAPCAAVKVNGKFDLGELERLARLATAGPWWTECENDGENDGVYAFVPGGRPNGEGLFQVRRYYGREAPNWRANRDFVAAANPAVVLTLIEAIRERNAEADRLRYERDQARWERDYFAASVEASQRERQAQP